MNTAANLTEEGVIEEQFLLRDCKKKTPTVANLKNAPTQKRQSCFCPHLMPCQSLFLRRKRKCGSVNWCDISQTLASGSNRELKRQEESMRKRLWP